MEMEMAMMETETGAEKRMVNARRDRGSGGTGSAGSACFQLEGQRKHNGRVLGTTRHSKRGKDSGFEATN